MAITKIRSSSQLFIDKDLDLGNLKIIGLADPENPQDAATKQYVDNMALGIDAKASVAIKSIASAGWSTAVYANGTNGVGATLTVASGLAGMIDGSIAVNDRVLITNAAVATANGIYVVTATSAGSSATFTRATDFDTPSKATPGAFVFVEKGATFADTGWILSTDTAITFGTTAINFVQFSRAGVIEAGNGLTQSGNTFNVVGTTNRIVVLADSIDLATVSQGAGATLSKISIDSYGRVTGNTAATSADITNLFQSIDANKVWAGPSATGANTPTFRSLVAADIPSLDASKIGSGVLTPAIGGTGVNNGVRTITVGGNLTTGGTFTTVGTFSTAGAFSTIGAFSIALTATAATAITLPTTGTLSTLDGVETLTNKTLTAPTINNPTISGATLIGAYITENSGITFEGSVDDAHETYFSVLNPTADRTINLPDASGTVALLEATQIFTGVQTFRGGTTSIRVENGASKDAIILAGRNGGTAGYAVTMIPTTLTSNWTLTLANGNTTLQAGTMAVTGTNLSQFAATTSAQLAGVISDETGSGSLVFATSPTLTTPKINAIVGTAVGSNISLYDTTTTGNITIGGGLTTGGILIGSYSGDSTIVGETVSIGSGSLNLHLGLGATTIYVGDATTSILYFSGVTGTTANQMLYLDANKQVKSAAYLGTPVTNREASGVVIGAAGQVSTFTFTEDGSTIKSNIQVWLNGILMKEGADYTLTNTLSTDFVVTFVAALGITAEDKVVAAYYHK